MLYFHQALNAFIVIIPMIINTLLNAEVITNDACCNDFIINELGNNFRLGFRYS